MVNKTYDVIIIGAGPAGLTSGIYTSRARLKTLIIERGVPGGQLALTHNIENYPGFSTGISGFELAEKMHAQATKFGAQTINAEVTKISDDKNVKIVHTDKDQYSASAIIVAVGASPRKLAVPGEDRLIGRGVSYCATCDGRFFEGKSVTLVGGGDSAIEEAIFLTRFCEKVTIIHRRDKLRATKILQEYATNLRDKMDFVWNSKVTEILGKDKVESVVVNNTQTGEVKNIVCDGIFVYIGQLPNSSFLYGYIDMDESGYIFTNDDMKTSVDGIYACGDIRKKTLKQVIVACGEGAIAGVAAQHHIEQLKKIVDCRL